MSGDHNLVNPIHFFNSRGISILLAESQEAQIAQLSKEVYDLRLKLRASERRVAQLTTVD